MELEQLKDIWSAYDKKLDQHLQLNRRILREMKLGKVRSSMRGLITKQIVGAVVVFAIISALYVFIANNFSVTAPTISAAVLLIFASILLIGILGQITIASQIDYSRPIVIIQQQLERMKLHNLRFFRLFMFSGPFYMAYIFLGVYVLTGVDFYQEASAGWFRSQIAFSGVMLIAVLVFNRLISNPNSPYRWVRKFIEEIGGKEVVDSQKFLRELEDFEREE